LDEQKRNLEDVQGRMKIYADKKRRYVQLIGFVWRFNPTGCNHNCRGVIICQLHFYQQWKQQKAISQ